MSIVGIGASAPAVVAGEFAAAQPAGSPTVPTQIQVPTPTMGARAEDLQIMAQATIDGLKAIKDTAITFAGVKTFASAPVFAAGAHVSQSQSLIADGTGASITGVWTINVGAGGSITVPSAGTLTAASGSTSSLLGRVVPRSARVSIADAPSKRIGVKTGTSIDYAGKRFQLPNTATTSPNVIVLDHTNAPPSEGETIECIWTKVGGIAGAIEFEFHREAGTIVAQFVSTLNATNMCIWAEFEFVSGVWRLGANPGTGFDTSMFGVRAGSGA